MLSKCVDCEIPISEDERRNLLTSLQKDHEQQEKWLSVRDIPVRIPQNFQICARLIAANRMNISNNGREFHFSINALADKLLIREIPEQWT